MRLLRYLVINAAFAAALWFGFFRDIAGARNLVQFYVWFVFAVSLFFFSDDVSEAAAKVARPVPRWTDTVLDAAACGVLVWFGWWWTAAAYVVAMVFSRSLTEVAPGADQEAGGAAGGSSALKSETGECRHSTRPLQQITARTRKANFI